MYIYLCGYIKMSNMPRATWRSCLSYNKFTFTYTHTYEQFVHRIYKSHIIAADLQDIS